MRGAPIRKRLVALAALVVLSAISVVSILNGARASDLWFFYSLRDNYAHKAKGIQIPSMEELFNKSSLMDYEQFKKIEDCGSALSFIEFAVRDLIRSSKEDLGDAAMLQKIIVAKNYQEQLYCGAMKSVNRAEFLAKKHNLKDWTFPENSLASGELETTPTPLGSRNWAIVNLLLLAFEDYAPAQLTLVRLSEKSEAIRLTRGFAYYLLARAKILGATDADLEAMLEKAGAGFHPADRVKLDLIAAAGQWPRDEPILAN